MRCLLFLFVACAIFAPAFTKQLDVQVDAEAVILINAATGAILYEKNAHQQYQPASTTKVATALYALHQSADNINRLIIADRESLASISADAKKRGQYSLPAYWLEPDGSHIGIKNEEKLSLKDLLAGMLIVSGNDAANVIAKDIGGSIPTFIERLNAYLKDLGCHNTVFYNPHGLYHPKHLTTPYDMALLTIEALKFPLFREIVASQSFNRPKTNKQESTILPQTNHLVRKNKPSYYSKAIGVKTGYISAAQHTLIAAAKDKDRTLVAVLFKSKAKKDTFIGAKKLFEAAFNQPKVERVLLNKGRQSYVLDLKGAVKPILTYVTQDVTIQYYPAEEEILQAAIKWNDPSLPIEKGQKIGEIRIFNAKGNLLQNVPLLAEESVSATWGHWLKSFFK